MQRNLYGSRFLGAMALMTAVLPAAAALANRVPPGPRVDPQPLLRIYQFEGLAAHEGRTFILAQTAEFGEPQQSARRTGPMRPPFVAHVLAEGQDWQPRPHSPGATVTYRLYAVRGEVPRTVTQAWLDEQESALSVACDSHFPHLGEANQVGHRERVTYAVRIESTSNGDETLRLFASRVAQVDRHGTVLRERRLADPQAAEEDAGDAPVENRVPGASGSTGSLALISGLAALMLFGLALGQRRRIA